LCRLPRTLLRMMLGEFASAMLDDQHIAPKRAEAFGFRFAHPAWRLFLAEHFSQTPGGTEHFRPRQNPSANPGTRGSLAPTKPLPTALRPTALHTPNFP